MWNNKRCYKWIVHCCWCSPSHYCSTYTSIITLSNIAWCTRNYLLLCIINRYCKTTCNDIAMNICRSITNCCSTYWKEIPWLMWTNKRCYWTNIRFSRSSPGYYCSILPCIITLCNIAWCTWNYWLLCIIYRYCTTTCKNITMNICCSISYCCGNY